MDLLSLVGLLIAAIAVGALLLGVLGFLIYWFKRKSKTLSEDEQV